MIEITGGKKEQVVREWFNETYDGLVPTRTKVLDLFQEFDAGDRPEDISYGLFNGVIKKIVAEGHFDSSHGGTGHSVVVEPNVIKVEDMQFPSFGLFKTGKKIDDLFSDHEEGGGLYGGTVNIVIGESGVGKSTVMLDLLASIVDQNPDSKILYISSEMTRNDIMFYYRKTPAIGKVPTLLLMDYVKGGQLAPVLEKTFNDQYDIILLDSYQDVLVKLKEVQGWKSTKAESWLTNMMIEAAEKNGCAVLAIQHMTKGGQYVGSTYLKHATTAMLEIRFDLSGQRYIEFSKNRRGGSGTGKRLYYKLDEEGKVVYDTRRFEETEEMRSFENAETLRQQDLSQKFEEVFLRGAKLEEEDYSVEEVTVEDED
ncbi:AAA domain containing protein [uncultured Caudovirales phage]|uniref:AAA domain containing protein n=1 Tax=uncultured Caudovirales phage TaxID=2100421 RepID=A0A6J5NPZ9_9CAUD|nr:AAA domain containing protein [uncultured Caudovirales phage]